MVRLWRHQGKQQRWQDLGVVVSAIALAGSTRSFSRCAVTRVFEPPSSRLYGVGGLSVLGGIGADAIVKSSTNLQNSVSLNSRMLAYAATMRSARTRAWRSP
jgi:hypothetical protein